MHPVPPMNFAGTGNLAIAQRADGTTSFPYFPFDRDDTPL
jgi:hypothetical protein